MTRLPERLVALRVLQVLVATGTLWVSSAGGSVARAQATSALAARDAFTASLAGALPPLPLDGGREISLRYGATKYYWVDPLQQNVAVSAVVPFWQQKLVGLTVGHASPDCVGCPRWFLAGIDYGGRIGSLPRFQATASFATGFNNLARSATSVGLAIPVTKRWSQAFVSAHAGVALAGASTSDARARAVRPTTAAVIGWRTRRMSFDVGAQAVLLTARPPVVGARFGWRPRP